MGGVSFPIRRSVERDNLRHAGELGPGGPTRAWRCSPRPTSPATRVVSVIFAS